MELQEVKTYEIQQRDDKNTVLSSAFVEATSAEVASQQLGEIANGTTQIIVLLEGHAVNEMGLDFWRKKVRRR